MRSFPFQKILKMIALHMKRMGHTVTVYDSHIIIIYCNVDENTIMDQY